MTKEELLISVGCPLSVGEHGNSPCERCGAMAGDLETLSGDYDDPRRVGGAIPSPVPVLLLKIKHRKSVRPAMNHWRS